MKNCTHCGATNPDEARFCLRCGTAVVAKSVPNSPLQQSSALHPSMQVPETLRESVASTLPDSVQVPLSSYKILQDIHQKHRMADIMFVLDCTGSMQGEIDAVRDAIMQFVEAIEAESVRARVGLIEFRDRLVHEEHRVLQFNGQPFTNDSNLFRQQIAYLRAQGGGDEPESSLDAIMLALEQPFDPAASKVIVLVTDAPPHIPDQTTRSIEEVINRMKQVQIDQMYIVMRTHDQRNQVYLKLLEVTRGLAFDIGKGDDFRTRAEDFKRTLMALGRTISSATLRW